MKNFISLSIIFAIVSSFPCVARAGTEQPQVIVEASLSPPDITGWNVVDTSRIELIVSDDIIAYLGFSTEYNNPDDPSEFVRVYSRHIPLVIAKTHKVNERMAMEVYALIYNQQEAEKKLRQVSLLADPFIYERWKMTKNLLTGRQDKLDGDVGIWFMPAEGLRADGSWYLFKNERVGVEFFTENINSNKPKAKPYNVFSGIEYRVGDLSHMIRLDRNILIALAGRGK